MADERSLSDVFWDYGVYAPIGLAISIVEEIPRLSDKGRERASSQIHLARVIGKMAVGQGKRQFGKLLGQPSRPVTTRPVAGRGEAPAPPPPAPPRSASTRSNGAGATRASRASHNGSAGGARPAGMPTRDGPPTRRATPGASAPTRGVPRAARATAPPAHEAAVAAESLAIPGYDTLAASQVVQRLSSLRGDELEAIRRYELATRGRRTILHRIAQLSTDR
ncbi:MAG TPA: hypothetical protein VEH29_02155 [Acidimicrobiales bacterium]|nr:hypothetical protein [Acidimicrobiales bacterium]